jgi:RNA polymerase sigma-70 factor (ECF subfamily)
MTVSIWVTSLSPTNDPLATQIQVKNLEKLFKEFQPMLVGFAYKYVKSSEDAKGIVQEVFVSVWKNRDHLQLDGKLKSYLFTATKNKSLNFLDKRRIQTVSIDASVVEDRAEIQLDDGNNIASEDMELAELQVIISNEIGKLPPKCQEIFLLSRKEQLSYKEIAAKLEVSTKTVENQIGIAIKRIRKRVFSYQNLNDLRVLNLLFLIFFNYSLGDDYLFSVLELG